MNKHTLAQLNIIMATVIWSTIGMVRRFIDFPSGFIALVRGAVGVLFLIGIAYFSGKVFNWEGIQKNLGKLILAGAFLGTNWAVLFEAYQHTNVAVAELFYYTDLLFVILLNPIVMKEKITFRQCVCVTLALLGMVLVSQIYTLDINMQDSWGIILAITAAVLVSGVVFTNKLIDNIGTYERAIPQLLAATLALVPYIFFTTDLSVVDFSNTQAWLLTLGVGMVHTGIAYTFYYNGIANVKAQEVCILGYLDPLISIFWAALVFGETLGALQIVGAALIIGSMLFAQLRG